MIILDVFLYLMVSALALAAVGFSATWFCSFFSRLAWASRKKTCRK